ncbi:MAG: hypothetical protein HY432_01590 [Candidatus Liptonbacteria bacterium]|nr:hypothetical protein [Candidatus Liptonbacteria bacterium]
MQKQRFSEILGNYGFNDRHIDLLWEGRKGHLNEELAANIARLLAPISREVHQAKR